MPGPVCTGEDAVGVEVEVAMAENHVVGLELE